VFSRPSGILKKSLVESGFKMKRFLQAVSVVFLMLSFSSAGECLVMIEMNMDELTSGADAIIRGRVSSKSSEWNESKTLISTVVTVDVIESFKGSVNGSVKMRLPGGEVGAVGQKAVGVPVFKTGDEAILFLEKKDGMWDLIGYGQGKFSIEKDSPAGGEFVVNDAGGALLVGKDLSVNATAGKDGKRQYRMKLADFTAELKNLLRKQQAEKESKKEGR